MTRRMNETALDNVAKVVEGEVEASSHVDATTAVAYTEEKEINHRLSDIKKKMDSSAKAVMPEERKVETPKVKNTYTKTYTLDESIKDFNIKSYLKEATALAYDPKKEGNALWQSLSDDDEDDPYFDYTMQDFVTSLANYSGSGSATANPLERGKKYKRFSLDTKKGIPQITTDRFGNGDIHLGSDDVKDFDDIMAILDIYKIKYTGPVKTPGQDWDYHLYIDVPKTAPGYPMLMVDYFEDIGIDPGSVMSDVKWGDRYRRAQAKLAKNADIELDRLKRQRAKDRAASDKQGNENRLKSIYDDAVTTAWRRGDIDLDTHFSNMLSTLDAEGIRYSKIKLKKQFMDEFEDDFEDED